MKQFLPPVITLFLFSIFPLAMYGQPILTGDDLPNIGDALTFSTDNSVDGLTPGAAGADQTWDFSQLEGEVSYTSTFISPSDAFGNEQFPDATIALETDTITDEGAVTGYSFLQETDNGLFNLGFSADFLGTGTPVQFTIDPPQQLLALPTTTSTTFTDVSVRVLQVDGAAFSEQADSARITTEQTRTVTVDGWGTLTTPAGTFDALRQRVDIVSEETFEVKIGGVWTDLGFPTQRTFVEYEWMSPEGSGPVLTMTLDDNGMATSATYFESSAGGGEAPVVSFTFDDQGDGAYRFTDQSTNDPTFWNWDFGDDNTSDEQNPTHTYTTPGDYTVCLTAGNDAGSDTGCQDITAVLVPEAAFAFEVMDDGVVQFTDESTNDPTSWSWDFGDGNTSDEQNPEHTYAESGDYTVCLTATNEAGSNEGCTPLTITITSVARLADGRRLTAFPNPAADRLTFTLERGRERLQLLLTNVLGQVQYEGFLQDRQPIDVSAWAPGNYFYQVRSMEGEVLAGGQIVVE